jgi:hypothetical protein
VTDERQRRLLTYFRDAIHLIELRTLVGRQAFLDVDTPAADRP